MIFSYHKNFTFALQKRKMRDSNCFASLGNCFKKIEFDNYFGSIKKPRNVTAFGKAQNL